MLKVFKGAGWCVFYYFCAEKRKCTKTTKKISSEKREAWAVKTAGFSSVVFDAGCCKRMPPSLNQIKNYLKKVKKVSRADLDQITKENVDSKFYHFHPIPRLEVRIAPVKIQPDQ